MLVCWRWCVYESNPPITKLGQGDSIVHLYSRFLKSIAICYPPLPEQKAIASLLEKWDTAIEKTEALIAAKEKQFKWLLKTLISDQKDNPGWREVRLNDLIRVIPIQKKLKKNTFLPSGKYPIIDQSKSDIVGWFNDETAVIRSKKSLVIFGDHTCIVKYFEKPFGQGADGIKVLETTDSLLPKFLYFLLLNRPIKPEGYKRHFSKLKDRTIFMPPLTEQNHITDMLDIANKEIKLFKQLTEKYRTQKRGLMQKLLTGQWKLTL